MGTLVDLSIKRTGLILFKPFSIKKWLCLLLIASLAGTVGGGGNSGSGHHKEANATQNEQQILKNKPETLPFQYQQGAKKLENITKKYHHKSNLYRKIKSFFGSLPPAIMAIAVLIGLILIILLLWLSCRFKFVWFDSIIKNDASIVEPFKKYKKEGDSLFEFYLFIILALIAFGILIAGFGLLTSSLLYVTIWIFILLVIAAIIFLLLLFLIIEHFIVTIMAMDNCLFNEAWDKFKEIYHANQKELWFYLLVIIGLGIVCWIIETIATLIWVLIILLAAAIFFGIPYLLIGVLLKLTPIFIAYAVLAGIPFVAIVIILLLSIGLPIAVFFRSFSLYFISSLQCPYNPLPLE
jgi:hypothetical protein